MTPDGRSRPRGPVLPALAVGAAVIALGAASLFRPGYSPDEEYTLFAVRGIHAHGIPLLPSGLFYDRGLAYSYLCWMVGSLTGLELPAYRFVGLASAVLAAGLLFSAVRRLASPPAAVLAALLVTTSVPFWSVATSGRFYGPFLAAYLAVLAVLVRAHTRRPSFTPDLGGADGTGGVSHALGAMPTLAALVAFAALARLTHELAFTLAIVPAAFIVFGRPDERRGWRLASAAVAVGLVLAQAGMMALNYLGPQSGGTMIKRFFLWQVLNLFEVPPPVQVGVPLAAMTIGWLLAPRRAGLMLVVALCGVALVLGAAVARALATAPFSWALAGGVLADASRYPLDMFWHIARTTPVMPALALALLVARLAGAGGPWPAHERGVHMAWVGWVTWFGVIESGITTNYLLLPVTFMLAAIAVDLAALVRAQTSPARAALARALVILALAAIGGDEWRGPGGPAGRLHAARPTIDVAGIDGIRAALSPADLVACTDELACLLLVGRADAWLALDDYVRERFVVTRGTAAVGVYAGAPAVMRPVDLFAIETDGPRPTRVLVVDVFKDYPVGSSSSWLPRAVDADGLEWRMLLETPQARVVELSRPAQNAALNGTIEDGR